MSPRENVLAALVATLSPILPASVWRSRKEQLPTIPAIVVRPESEEDLGEMLGVTDATLTVAIEIYARGEIPDQAADPLLADVLDALKVDATLGLGSDVQVLPRRRIDWDIENYDDAGVTVRVDIDYRTLP